MIKNNITRLFINKALKLNAIIELDNSNKHYLKNVLRLTKGCYVNVFNGVDGEWQSIFDFKGDYFLKCKALVREQKPEGGPKLYFALIKNHNVRWMIEKVTELGVQEITPIITERSNNKNFNEKKAWSHIKEAAEISERLTLPKLNKSSLTTLITFSLKQYY